MPHATTDLPGTLDTLMAEALADLTTSGATVLALGCQPSTRTALAATGRTIVEEPGDVPAAAVVLGTPLGQLDEPVSTLAQAASHLDEGAPLLVTFPNLAHGSRRLAALAGQQTEDGSWPLALEDGAEILRAAGLAVHAIGATSADVLDGAPTTDPADLPEGVVEWLRDQPEALDAAYLLTCARATQETGEGHPLPLVSRTLPPRPHDVFRTRRDAASLEALTASRREALLTSLTQERYDRLTNRDAVIGLEAHTATLKRDVIARDQALHEVREELIEAHTRLAQAIADSQQAHTRLAEVTTDCQQAHAHLAEVTTDCQQAHTRLAEVTTDCQQAHTRLSEALAELGRTQAELAQVRAQAALRTVPRRVAGKVARALHVR